MKSMRNMNVFEAREEARVVPNVRRWKESKKRRRAMKMKSMRSMLVLLAVGALAAGGAFGDYVSLVSVNFEHSDEVMTGAAGAGASGDVWNNLPNNTNGRYMDLLGSDNVATTINYWKSTVGSGQCSSSPTANNLFNGYTRGDTPYSTDFSAGKLLSLQGLDSGKTYDIYLYSGYNWATATTAFKVGSDVKQPVNTSKTVDSFVENENYVVFSGISPDASGEILVYYSNGDTPFNGFQIGAIPEPGTLGLLALSGGGILFLRKRTMI